MFDFARIIETVGGAIGQTTDGTDGLNMDTVLQGLAEQGVDLEQLHNLDVEQLSTLLTEHGFDPQQLDLSHWLDTGSLSELPLSDWVSRLTDRAA